MNKVILVGRLTKDPELRRTNNDIPFVLFTIAVNRIVRQGAEKTADFLNCVAWRNLAENLAKFMRKGSLVGIEGQLQTRNYDDANGIRRFITEVVCDNIHFLESKSQSRGEYNQGFPDIYQNDRKDSDGDYRRQSNEYKNKRDDINDTKDPFEDIGNDFNVSNDDLPF